VPHAWLSNIEGQRNSTFWLITIVKLIWKFSMKELSFLARKVVGSGVFLFFVARTIHILVLLGVDLLMGPCQVEEAEVGIKLMQ